MDFNIFKKEIMLRLDLNFILNRRTNEFIFLDEIGVDFVECTLKSKTIDETIQKLKNIYDIERDVLESDLKKFWNDIFNAKSQMIKQRGGVKEWVDIKKIKYPLSIEIELTKVCNWNCKFCYNVWKYNNSEKGHFHISIEEIQKIINESNKHGIKDIRLSGGEPLLHPEFFDIVKLIKEHNISVVLFTNGSQINANNITDIEKYIDNILFSLHGPQKWHDDIVNYHGAYESVLNTIELCNKKGMDISVETTVTDDLTLDSLLEVGQVLNEMEINKWNLMPFVEVDNDLYRNKTINFKKFDNILKILKEKFKNITIRVACSQKLCFENNEELLNNEKIPALNYDGNCGAGVSWISVSYDSKIRHCPHSNIYAGTIDDGIQQVYTKKILPKVQSILENRKQKCGKCITFTECKGGCYLNEFEKY